MVWTELNWIELNLIWFELISICVLFIWKVSIFEDAFVRFNDVLIFSFNERKMDEETAATTTRSPVFQAVIPVLSSHYIIIRKYTIHHSMLRNHLQTSKHFKLIKQQSISIHLTWIFSKFIFYSHSLRFLSQKLIHFRFILQSVLSLKMTKRKHRWTL